MAIVSILERGDSISDLFEVAEDAPMNSLLLQRAVEAFGDTVSLGFGHKGEARSDAPEPDLVKEVIGRVLRPVIHAQRQAASGLSARGTEFDLKPLSNRLQGREAAPGLHGMDADTTGIEMIDGLRGYTARSMMK